MTAKVYELNPVKAITAGALGEPGHRVFYIQGRTLDATVTLLTEKAQVQMLAHGIYQLLAEIVDKYPTVSHPTPVAPLDLELSFPLEPDFRMAGMELGYDSASDLVVLVAHELVAEDPEADAQIAPGAPSVARLFATRAQMHAMADHALEVAASGRPICALCGQPNDAQGHVCPRRNGHPPTPAAF